MNVLYVNSLEANNKELARQLASANVLIAEQNKLAKERQEWALHTNEVIRSLNQQLAAAHENIKIANSQTEEFERKWYLANDALEDSQKREVMLRDALTKIKKDAGNPERVWRLSKESLAATADLKNVRLCHAEPVAWIDGGDLRELGNGNDRQYSLWCENQDRMVPFYRAWEPKP